MRLFNKKEIIKRGRQLLLLMLPTIPLGILLGSYPGYKTYEYVWKDERFCTACHVHDYASLGWEDSSHKEYTTCHDCHHQPLHKYIEEAYLYVTKDVQFPRDLKHTPHVPKELCKSCHVSTYHDKSTLTGPLEKKDLKDLPMVDRTRLHNVHLNAKVKLTLIGSYKFSEDERVHLKFKMPTAEPGPERQIECSDCHGGPANRAHTLDVVDVSCVRCHQNQHEDEFAKVYGCKTCHFQEFVMPND